MSPSIYYVSGKKCLCINNLISASSITWKNEKIILLTSGNKINDHKYLMVLNCFQRNHALEVINVNIIINDVIKDLTS